MSVCTPSDEEKAATICAKYLPKEAKTESEAGQWRASLYGVARESNKNNLLTVRFHVHVPSDRDILL